MKTMTSRKEPDPLESKHAQRQALLHRCPVCNTIHEVSATRAQFAYGRQLACSPDCEAERRRRSRASHRLAAKVSPAFPRPLAGKPSPANRADADSRGHGTLHLVGAHEQKVALSVTVESADVLSVRRAVFQSGAGAVGILKVTPVPRSARLRLSIGTKADAVVPIMAAIMRSVTACEFGRIARL